MTRAKVWIQNNYRLLSFYWWWFALTVVSLVIPGTPVPMALHSPKLIKIYGMAAVFARLSGQLAKPCMALMIPLICRHFVTFTRSTFLRFLYPADMATALHKQLAYVFGLMAAIHSFAHIDTHLRQARCPPAVWQAAWRFPSTAKTPPNGVLVWYRYPAINGYVMFTIMLFGYLFALKYPRQLKCIAKTRVGKFMNNFNVFFYTHVFMAGSVIVLFLLHPLPYLPWTRNQWGVSDTWIWLTVPLLILIGEYIYRFTRSRWSYRHCRVVEARLLPSNALALKITKPNNFSYKPGMYIFLQCPRISQFQWHPFTLTSAPHEKHLSVMLRTTGDWTMALRRLFQDYLVEVESALAAAESAGNASRLSQCFSPEALRSLQASFRDVTSHTNLLVGSGCYDSVTSNRTLSATAGHKLPPFAIAGCDSLKDPAAHHTCQLPSKGVTRDGREVMRVVDCSPSEIDAVREVVVACAAQPAEDQDGNKAFHASPDTGSDRCAAALLPPESKPRTHKTKPQDAPSHEAPRAPLPHTTPTQPWSPMSDTRSCPSLSHDTDHAPFEDDDSPPVDPPASNSPAPITVTQTIASDSSPLPMPPHTPSSPPQPHHVDAAPPPSSLSPSHTPVHTPTHIQCNRSSTPESLTDSSDTHTCSSGPLTSSSLTDTPRSQGSFQKPPPALTTYDVHAHAHTHTHIHTHHLSRHAPTAMPPHHDDVDSIGSVGCLGKSKKADVGHEHYALAEAKSGGSFLSLKRVGSSLVRGIGSMASGRWLDSLVAVKGVKLPKPPRLVLDTAIGSPLQSWFKFPDVVLIAAGAGITPFLSVLSSFTNEEYVTEHYPKVRRVTLVWVFRDFEALSWLDDLVSQLRVSTITAKVHLTLRLFITGDPPQPVLGESAGGQPVCAYAQDVLDELKTRVQVGVWYERPNWDSELEGVAGTKGSPTAPFSLGPHSPTAAQAPASNPTTPTAPPAPAAVNDAAADPLKKRNANPAAVVDAAAVAAVISLDAAAATPPSATSSALEPVPAVNVEQAAAGAGDGGADNDTSTQDVARVGVFYCGPPSIGSVIKSTGRRLCRAAGDDLFFHFFMENF